MKPLFLALALLSAAYTAAPNDRGPHREAEAGGGNSHPSPRTDRSREWTSYDTSAIPEYGMEPVQLPILVGFGPDGGITGSETTVTLTAGPEGADSLYFHAMNAAYAANDRPGTATFDPANLSDLSRHERRDDAACLLLGGAEFCGWNTNPHVSIRARERTGGGFGGWYANVRAAVALPAALPAGGTVAVTFRWNGTEGLRSGYRIFELDLIGPSGRQHHPTTLRDPQPYSTHPDSIAQGRALWSTRHILRDFGPDGQYRQIIASCNDCHVSGGRDLARFNYEEGVITARGVFHGLTKGQSRNIASYAVSLALSPANGPECRPWNPPFQPGPGVDNLSVGRWLCGGGADAVLEADRGMVPQLFPRSTHPDSIRSLYGGETGADWRHGINRRVIPIPHQLPLWNQWLPRISLPDMALDWPAYCQGEFTLCFETSDLGRREDWGRMEQFDAPQENADAIDRQRRFFQGTSGGVTHEYYLRQNGVQLPVRRAPYTPTGFWHQIANQSLNQTLAVRLFDVLTHQIRTPWGESGWELANDITCAVPGRAGYGTWPDGTMLLGATAPGTAPQAFNNDGSPGGDLHATRSVPGRDALSADRVRGQDGGHRGGPLNHIRDEVGPPLHDVRAGSGLPRTIPADSARGGVNRTTCAEAWGTTAAQVDWTIFAVSTHIAARDGTGGPWDYASNHVPAVGVANANGFGGHIWYALAAILEPPSRFTAPGSPQDVNYIFGHTFGAGSAQRPASLLAIADGISHLQQMQGPLPTPGTDGNWKGWYPHHMMQIPWFYREEQWEATAAQIGLANAVGIQEGLALAWLDWSERYPLSAWDAVRGTNYGDLDPRATTFAVPADPRLFDFMTPGVFLINWIALLEEMGAREATVDRMARFGASLFDSPSGFAAFFCEQPCGEEPPPPPPPVNNPPTVVVTRPVAGQKNLNPSPLVVTVDATERDAGDSVREVRLLCDRDGDGDRELCGTDTTAPYAFSVALTGTNARRTLSVEGEDMRGGVTATTPISFTIRVRASR